MRDPVVRPHPEFADTGGSLVRVQETMEQLLVSPGRRRDDTPTPEGEMDPFNEDAAIDPGQVEGDLPLRAVVNGGGVDLAVGHVEVAIAHGVPPTSGGEGEVRAAARDGDPLRRLKDLRQGREAPALRGPVPERGGEEEVHGLEEAHARLLG